MGLILHWKKHYGEGKLVEGASQTEKALWARNAELERIVGSLTMEDEILKKAVGYNQRRRRENSSPVSAKRIELLTSLQNPPHMRMKLAEVWLHPIILYDHLPRLSLFQVL